MLLQLLVRVVDAQLFEVVLNEDLEPEDVQHSDEQVRVLTLNTQKNRRKKVLINMYVLQQGVYQEKDIT